MIQQQMFPRNLLCIMYNVFGAKWKKKRIEC
jgi:hypothetical protein